MRTIGLIEEKPKAVEKQVEKQTKEIIDNEEQVKKPKKNK